MVTKFSTGVVLLICILVLVACDVRPFSDFAGGNDGDGPWEHEVIPLSSGGAFHPALAGMPATLIFGDFDGPIGRFMLEQDSIVQAAGDVIISDDVCTFFVTFSSCPLDVGGQIRTASRVPCEIDPDERLLILVPAQPAELAHRTFTCPDGTAFEIPESNPQLDFSGFTRNVSGFTRNSGNFDLSSGDLLAHGVVTARDSCKFQVTESNFLPGQGPQVGVSFTFDRCEVDTVSGRLFVGDVHTSLVCHLLTK